MRAVACPSSRGVSPYAVAVLHPLCSSQRYVSIAGGGRGDLFKRHAAVYKAPYAGSARGIRQHSESTEPQDGQLHIRKRHDHIAYDHMYSGGAYYRPAVAAWSYLIPSLRKNVEVACPDALYEKLTAGEDPLTAAEQQQLTDAQHLFRFELQQRIGLLEDSLAEAELPYLIQWPSLFHRVWLRLPLISSIMVDNAAKADGTTASSHSSSPLTPSQTSTLVPISTAVWASSSSSRCGAPLANKTNASFSFRLSLLTRHVADCVEEELRRLEAATPAREDGSPRSRRQAALEAAWRAQWQSAVHWHSDKSQ